MQKVQKRLWAGSEFSVSIVRKQVLFMQKHMERFVALSVSQIHSAHCVLSSHSCISSRANFRSNDMLHHVLSADSDSIL